MKHVRQRISFGRPHVRRGQATARSRAARTITRLPRRIGEQARRAHGSTRRRLGECAGRQRSVRLYEAARTRDGRAPTRAANKRQRALGSRDDRATACAALRRSGAPTVALLETGIAPIGPGRVPSEDRVDLLTPARRDEPSGPRPKTYLRSALETSLLLGAGTWFGGPARLSGRVERVERHGRAASDIGSSDETRAGLGAGFVF